MRIRIKRKRHSGKFQAQPDRRKLNDGISRTRPGWPEVYRWVAAGTLVVCTAVGSKTLNIAYAQAQRRMPVQLLTRKPPTPIAVRVG